PHPPLWRSVISVESLEECGRAGLPAMMSRVPHARIPERLAIYRKGLEAGGHDTATQRRLLGEASVWRFLYVADSQAQAEDDVQEGRCTIASTCTTCARRTTRPTSACRPRRSTRGWTRRSRTPTACASCWRA